LFELDGGGDGHEAGRADLDAWLKLLGLRDQPDLKAAEMHHHA
jgi:hypothetical protein